MVFCFLVLEVHQDAGLFGIALEEGEQSGQQADLIQGGGSQIKRQPAHAMEELIDERPRLLESAVGWVRRRPIRRFQKQPKSGQRLTDFVMQFAGQVPALGFLDFEQPAR